MATPETVTSGAGHSPPTNGTVVAPSGGTGKPPEQMSEAEFRAKNDRRVDLLEKMHREGLSVKEQSELEKVQAETRAWVDARHPLPPIDPRILELLREYGKIDPELPEGR